MSHQLKMEEFDGSEIKSKKTIEEIMEEGIEQGYEIKRFCRMALFGRVQKTLKIRSIRLNWAH